MNRDALLATVIGFGVGLLITGILLVGPNLRGLIPQISWPNFFGQGQSNNEAQPPEVTFTIDSPLEDAIEPNDEVLVSGSAQPGATVVLMGPTDELVVEASAEGKYAGRVALVEGANEILVTMYNDKGEPESLALTVFYTPEEF